MAVCVVSCWLCPLAPEIAGTRRDREPSQTGRQRPGVTGSLWIKDNMVLMLHCCYYSVESNVDLGVTLG